jgi:hypothetical protein
MLLWVTLAKRTGLRWKRVLLKSGYLYAIQQLLLFGFVVITGVSVPLYLSVFVEEFIKFASVGRTHSSTQIVFQISLFGIWELFTAKIPQLVIGWSVMAPIVRAQPVEYVLLILTPVGMHIVTAAVYASPSLRKEFCLIGAYVVHLGFDIYCANRLVEVGSRSAYINLGAVLLELLLLAAAFFALTALRYHFENKSSQCRGL